MRLGNRGSVPLWFAVVAAVVCVFVLIRGLIGDVASAAQQAAPQATLGMEVYDRTADSTLLASGADRPFPAESVVKLLIAIDALRHHTGSVAKVTQMLARSDDSIANALWASGGGPKIVTSLAAELHLQHTTAPQDSARWGDTTTTADDVVRIYRYLESAGQQTIVNALHHAPATAADGFDQSFGIPSLGVGDWWVKQGWGCCRPDRVLHTTGLVGSGQRYVVVILSSAPSSTNAADEAASITAATRALLPLLKAR
ncbi:hypothetical protein ACFFS4_30750 [Kutzneria kofuensis]|uniref:Beta-lactamase class A n=1 Tax=Kutzneria kofuensis TaxID=103725 RepID=A0A7W9KBQ1_9PSEU|nr:hypothetical protein [Kutzneria kofuensis]MBB5889233.1 hypothetical protein [Kutzneria kofuensis]